MIMAWVAVDKDGSEFIFEENPIRKLDYFDVRYQFDDPVIQLPKGSIKKLIGIELTWNDEPVELE